MTNDLAWMLKGVCRHEYPDIFFVEAGKSAEEARRVCARCPVLQTCRDWAIATDQKLGIWGGMTRRERIKVANDGKSMILTIQGCPVCRTPFMPKSRNHHYCSGKCRDRAEAARRYTLRHNKTRTKSQTRMTS